MQQRPLCASQILEVAHKALPSEPKQLSVIFLSPEIHQNGKIRKKKTKKIVHAICSTGWTVSYKCGILSFVQEEFFKLQHFECAGISRNVSSVSLPDKKACSTQMMTVS